MIQLFINVDIKKNASQLIRDLKQLHHSAWIGISLHGFVIVDMLLASYTAHESIWIEYFPTLYRLIYIMVTLALAPPDPWVTFDFKSDRSICCSSKISAQSQVVGKWLAILYLLYMISPLSTPGDLLSAPIVDLTILILMIILAAGLIRFDFRSDTSEIDI